MDDDDSEYGDVADEYFLEAYSQAPQNLPTLPPSHKRKRIRDDLENHASGGQRRNSNSLESGGSTSEEDEGPRAKKIRRRMVYGEKEVPTAKILGATQAEALEAEPDSSPYRIRGPIYKKPRPETHSQTILPGTNTQLARTPSLSRNSHATPSFSSNFGEVWEDIPAGLLDEDDDVVALSSSALPVATQDPRPRQRLVAVQQGLRQTTLFGHRADDVTPSQARKVHNYIVDKPPEPPTHHKLDHENLKTWVYPLNLGNIRDYQYSIVRQALFHNTLVALPTGLGKTCIAATIMLNYFRWTKDAQIIFVAPTKPLVAQQVDACFNIVGIPKSQTTLLTGEQPPALRADEWDTKRVFFMTPQTLENDLRSGIADPKKIVLLVVDEAHRATGNYAYVKVVELLRRFNKSFRVLALTATPGASVEAVQDVIDNLEIAKVEIRTEESIDIQQYVHRRNIDQILLDPSDEIVMVKELLSKSLQPLVNQLCAQNAYYNKDPMSLTPYGMLQARKSWFASPAGRAASMPVKGMMNALFAVLASIAHSIKLLNFHGIKPFYEKIKDFRNETEASKNGGGKYRKQILDSADFRKMMDRIQMWTSNADFVGHPKLTYLCDTIINHFLDAGDGRLGEDAPPSSTRVIVFAEFRDSAETIARTLNRHGPLLRASVFVGQADSKRSEGMKQSVQIETIEQFKKGKINVLVATSIGEEGLDIGQVDLIVCYDASGSPIRMLQRMGRTGRKRAGNIVLLLMRGKEEEAFAKAKDNYEQMQKIISSGSKFTFRYDLSVRIVPRDIVPEVDKRVIDIPLENTQDPSLPEPRRRAVKAKKRPAKKFHMPDGVETGFQKASALGSRNANASTSGVTRNRKPSNPTEADLSPEVPIHSVLLGPMERQELQRRYINVSGTQTQEVSMPDVTRYPADQRLLGPAVNVPHGAFTRRCIYMLAKLGKRRLVDFKNVELPRADELDLLARKSRASAKEDEFVPAENPSKRQRLSKSQATRTRCSSPVAKRNECVTDAGRRQKKRGKKKTQPLSLNESEGEGDDLVNSEVPSEDSDDGESLDDFIVLTGAAASSTVRSSTSPEHMSSPGIRRPSKKRGHLQPVIDSSDNEGFDGGMTVRNTAAMILDQSRNESFRSDRLDHSSEGVADEGDRDEDVRQEDTQRHRRRIILRDSDEDDEQ